MLTLDLRNNEAFEARIRLCPIDGASALSLNFSLNSPTSKLEGRIDPDDPRWIENDSDVAGESG